jgi:filamentous hemagglutinin
MKPWQRIGLIVCGIVVLVALIALRHNWAPPREAFVAPAAYSEPLWSSTPDMSAAENAEHHWRKHGDQFPALKSAADYEAAAHDFVSHPPPGTLIKHHGNGDTLFYDPASNTFAVARRDGAPRTMFKPDNGMRYWERQ